MEFSRLAETIPGSDILAINKTIKQRIKQGEKLYNLTVGDFDPSVFPIPKVLEDEIIIAYRQHLTNYPAAEGDLELRQAIAGFMLRNQRLAFSTDEIMVASGGRPLIYALYRAIVDGGEKVIYPVPGWNNHYYNGFVQGEKVAIQTKASNKFMPTRADIEPHIKGAVLLALCSPQNPSGTCFQPHELKAICEMIVAENNSRTAGEKKLYVLFDQMYSLLIHGQQSHCDPVTVCPEMRPYTIYVDAISKSFAATGVRVGWALGPAALIQKMQSILTHVGAWAPMAEQKGVARFLNNTDAVTEFIASFKSMISERLNLIYEGFQQLKNEGFPVDAMLPAAAIYLSIKIDIPNAQALLLDKAGIGILPFYAFGAPITSTWYRISVGTCRPEDIPVLLERFKKVLVEHSEKNVSGLNPIFEMKKLAFKI